MKIFFDGAGWNGKKSGYAVVFGDPGREPIVHWFSEKKTNNEMEYAALIEALKQAKPGDELVGDSQLVERQLSGRYQVKAENLKPLVDNARRLLAEKRVSVAWVPREENQAGKRLEGLARQKA